MNFQVDRILGPEEVARVLSALSSRTFVDGKLTASGPAREVKENLQADRPDAEPTDADQIILAALQRNQLFQSFAFPRRIMLPLFNRYEPGMQYGAHVDSAVMGTGTGQIRTDLAMTIFLSDPASYDGGELALETPFGEQEIKLDAGEAIVYPATTVHRVMPVTRGVRLAAVSWIQSSVRDERLRELLFDLKRAMSEPQQDPVLLHKIYSNLLRYAIEL
jgi:PKHD-type hydroxylase